MQCRVAYRHATDEHGLQTRNGGQGAGPSYLPLDGTDGRHLLLCGKLVCDGPARRPRDKPEPFLQVQRVNLVDHSVYLKGKVWPSFLHLSVVIQQAGHAALDRRIGARPESPVLELREDLAVAVRQLARLQQSDAVAEHFERTRGGDPRIQLPKAPGRRIARVDEDLFALLFGATIHLVEPGHRHDDLAADFQHLRPALALQPQRNRLDGTDVVRDVLSRRAVPARGRLHEGAAAIDDAHRQSVQLRLAGVVDVLLLAEAFVDPAVE